MHRARAKWLFNCSCTHKLNSACSENNRTDWDSSFNYKHFLPAQSHGTSAAKWLNFMARLVWQYRTICIARSPSALLRLNLCVPSFADHNHHHKSLARTHKSSHQPALLKRLQLLNAKRKRGSFPKAQNCCQSRAISPSFCRCISFSFFLSPFPLRSVGLFLWDFLHTVPFDRLPFAALNPPSTSVEWSFGFTIAALHRH